MNIIIIEDEPLMAQDLENEIVTAAEDVSVIGKFSSVEATLSYLSENKLPDLFFSDIQLSDGLSFEIFNHLKNPVPVIFCTAFDQYALQAFEANGIDYLLKPFKSEAIAKTLKKYKAFTRQPYASKNLNDLFKILQDRDTSKRSFLVHRGSKIIPVLHDDVRLAFLNNGVTYMITKDHKKHLVNHSLDSLDEMLGDDFYRANRQIIIHRKTVSSVSQFFARKLLVEVNLPFEERVIVSKANATHFLKWLESG